MANPQLIATKTISSSSVTIFTATAAGHGAAFALTDGLQVEIHAKDAGVWVHPTGGTAAADGQNCFHVPKDTIYVLTIEDGQSDVTAIRESSTDAKVTVSVGKFE